MSTALYRRYRPETFADVIGQEHVTEPLMQALRSGRVNHAYLFSGPRGCGKTTSARILARCLNCEQGPTPEPCGTCESCLALARGGPGAVDVIEIDAASHGGVDDARDLRERAAFGPAQSRYKVYIIDEAHMVTSHGFNALLKVVEEPPEHVKFIFATTEPDKVLSTIRSRTHHYPFHLVPPQRLTGYLEQLCDAEGVSLEPGVLSFVTRAGGGSVRDSLSVLDQLIAGADEGGVTYERAAALLGFTDVELLDSVVDAVGAQDAAAVFRQVDRVMESGHDPRRFVEDLLERYRDLIVIAAVGERAGGLLRGMPEDQVERLRQQASVSGAGTLTRCADVIAKGLSEMTGAVSYRLHLELICARLLLPAAAGEEGYAARLDRIERRLAAGPQPGPAAPQSVPSGRGRPVSEPAPEPVDAEPVIPQPTAAASTPAPTPAPAVPAPAAGSPGPAAPVATGAQPGSASAGAPGSLDTEAVRRSWPEVLDKVKEIRRVTWTLVSVNSTVLDYDGHRVLLGLSSEGLAGTFNQGVHAEVVRQGLIEAIGLDARVEGTAAAGGGGTFSAGGTPPLSQPAPGGAEPPPVAGGSDRPPADPPAPSAAEQLGVSARPPRGPAPSGGTPPAQEWAQSAREAPPAWATEPPQTPQASQAPHASQTAQASQTPRDSATPPVAHAAEPPQDSVSGRPDPTAGRRSHGDTGRGIGVAGESSPAAHPTPSGGEEQQPASAPGGDVPREDDEDLESSGAVGLPVIESVLGGTVISIDDDPTH